MSTIWLAAAGENGRSSIVSEKADLTRMEKCRFGDLADRIRLIRQFHRSREVLRRRQDFPLVETLYQWLFVPETLCPFNVSVLLKRAWVVLREEGTLPKAIRLGVRLLGEPPAEKIQRVAAEHEKHADQGKFEDFYSASSKYTNRKRFQRDCRELQADWSEIKRLFDVRKYEVDGVVRRVEVLERGIRPLWEFKWGSRFDRFHVIFDAFCQKWNLYGMKGDKPLLLKLSVNLTPFGTMVFIPAYWSLDPKRDLKWERITALHRARGVERQGPKLDASKLQNLIDAPRTQKLWKESLKRGLKGDERKLWVKKELGWSEDTDSSRLYRLLRIKPAARSNP